MDYINQVEETPLSSDEFAKKLTELNAFKLFMTVFPEFCNDYNAKIKFGMDAGDASNGVSVDLSISSQKKDEENYQILFNRLKKVNRLIELEMIIPELKKAGGSVDYINQLVDEGNNIAKNLYNDNV